MKPKSLDYTKLRLNRIAEALSIELGIEIPIWEAPASNLGDSFYLVQRLRESNGLYVNISSEVDWYTREWLFVVRSNYLDIKEFTAKTPKELPVTITKCAIRVMWQLIDKTKKRTSK